MRTRTRHFLFAVALLACAGACFGSVVITSPAVTVSYDIPKYAVSGTNSADIVGGMWVSNAADAVVAEFAAALAWTTPAFVLTVGVNTIFVSGTNDAGTVFDDSVDITRGGPGTGAPFLNITNADFVVTYDVTGCTIGGSNNVNVVGMMWWTNELTHDSGTFGPFAPGGDAWVIGGIDLDVGANLIRVFGSNFWYSITNDSLTVTRGDVGTGAPFVDATNAPQSVSYNTDTFDLAGTNNMHVAGDMWVSNAANGQVVTFAASQSWHATAIDLALDENPLTVYVTNTLGVVTNDTVFINRFFTNLPGLFITNVFLDFEQTETRHTIRLFNPAAAGVEYTACPDGAYQLVAPETATVPPYSSLLVTVDVQRVNMHGGVHQEMVYFQTSDAFLPLTTRGEGLLDADVDVPVSGLGDTFALETKTNASLGFRAVGTGSLGINWKWDESSDPWQVADGAVTVGAAFQSIPVAVDSSFASASRVYTNKLNVTSSSGAWSIPVYYVHWTSDTPLGMALPAELWFGSSETQKNVRAYHLNATPTTRIFTAPILPTNFWLARSPVSRGVESLSTGAVFSLFVDRLRVPGCYVTNVQFTVGTSLVFDVAVRMNVPERFSYRVESVATSLPPYRSADTFYIQNESGDDLLVSNYTGASWLSLAMPTNIGPFAKAQCQVLADRFAMTQAGATSSTFGFSVRFASKTEVYSNDFAIVLGTYTSTFTDEQGNAIEFAYNGKKAKSAEDTNELATAGASLVGANNIKITAGGKKNKLEIRAKATQAGGNGISARAYFISSDVPLDKIKLDGVRLQGLIMPAGSISLLQFVKSGIDSSITVTADVKRIVVRDSEFSEPFHVLGNVRKFYLLNGALLSTVEIAGDLRTLVARKCTGIGELFIRGSSKRLFFAFDANHLNGPVVIGFEDKYRTTENAKWSPKITVVKGNVAGQIRVNANVASLSVSGGNMEKQIYAAGQIKKVSIRSRSGTGGNLTSEDTIIRSGYYTNVVPHAAGQPNITDERDIRRLSFNGDCTGAKVIADSYQQTGTNIWICNGGSIGKVHKKKISQCYGTFVTKLPIKNVKTPSLFFTDPAKTDYIVDGNKQ